MKKCARAFYERDTKRVARELLGKCLVHGVGDHIREGRIVEVEAYLGPHDLASHSSKGRTPRTETMFGPAGHAYIYLIYGMYHCMNVVTQREGHASAVLIRALEPIRGIEARTQGPGLLCRAMEITRALNACDLVKDGCFYIKEAPLVPAADIVVRPRVGVDYAGEWKDKLLRYYIRDNPFVSKR